MTINNPVKGVRTAPKTNSAYDKACKLSHNSESFKHLLNNKTASVSQNPVRTDKIQISHSVQQGAGLELASIKSKITSDLRAETRAEKLERITKQVENNEYKVDPYELAQIMFRV